MTVKESQNKSQNHEDSAKPDGAFGQYIGSLGPENRVGEVAAKGSSQALRAGLLHKNKQGQEDANQDIDPQQNVDGEINHFRMPEQVG